MGQDIFHRLFEDILGIKPALDLQLRGDAGTEFHQFVIEQGEAAFQAKTAIQVIAAQIEVNGSLIITVKTAGEQIRRITLPVGLQDIFQQIRPVLLPKQIPLSQPGKLCGRVVDTPAMGEQLLGKGKAF